MILRRVLAALVVSAGAGWGFFLAAPADDGQEVTVEAVPTPVETTEPAASATVSTTPVDRASASPPSPPSSPLPAAVRPLRSADDGSTSPATLQRTRRRAARPAVAAPIVTHPAGIDVLQPVARISPVRVEIPAVGADGPVLSAGVDAAGELFIPPDARTLVWYGHGPAPGEVGSAVVAGHLDWDGVLGVFHRLADSQVGDVVTVSYSDGSRREFVVEAVELVPKPAIGQHGVFDRGGRPILRLVTCGGEFDDTTNHYLSNVVVTAVPSS